MASEESRKKAEEIIGRCDIFMLTSHVAARGVAIEIIAAALDEARAEGAERGEERAAATIRENVMTARQAAERERWECYAAATLAFAQFRGVAPAVVERRVSQAIAARGAMRGPEEE